MSVTRSDPPVDDAPPDVSSAANTGGKRRKSYGKVAKRGVAWAFFREGVSEMITTPTAIIMARLLTPFDFGVAASARFFVSLATRLTNLGFNQALVRIKDLKPEHCSTVFVVSLVLGAAAYGVLVGAASLIGAFFRTPAIGQVVPIAALSFVITPFGTVSAALMVRDMQFTRTATADWVSSLAEAVSAILLAWAGYGYWSIVYAHVVGSVATASAKLLLGSWRPSIRVSASALRDLFSFGTGVFAKRLLDYSAKNLDNLVVGRMLGVVSLGFYDKAFSTMNKVLVRLSTGGPMVTFRVFSLIHEDRDRFQRAYRKVALATALVSFPVLVGIAAAGPEVIIVMYGERWIPAVAAFQILCIAGAFNVLNEYAGMAAQATGRIWGQVTRQAIYTGLVLVLVAVFSRAGIAGAAFGVLLATLAMAVMMNALVVRLTAIPSTVVLGAQVPGLIAAACVAASVLASRALLADALPARWQLLIVEVISGAAAYALFLRLNRFAEVRRLLRDTADDLPRPLGPLVRILASA